MTKDSEVLLLASCVLVRESKRPRSLGMRVLVKLLTDLARKLETEGR